MATATVMATAMAMEMAIGGRRNVIWLTLNYIYAHFPLEGSALVSLSVSLDFFAQTSV